jgi:hypothetical protein
MVGTINPHIELSSISNPPCWAHIKKPFGKIAKGLEIDKLPLLDTFRTFKGNITTENVRLNQLILQY